MYDLISIGDCVVDSFILLEDAEVEVVNGEKKLCLRYGDKIPVGPSVSVVAGNSANNAVGASRLGLKTAIYTNVGNKDEEKYDLRIIKKLKEEGVDTRYIKENTNLPSNHHIVLNFKGERTILIYHQPWEYRLPDLETSKWIYFTSLSPTFTSSHIVSELINYLERTGSKLLYNPGTFQIKAGVLKSPRLLSLTELFIVNLEEAKIILGFKEADNIPVKKLLKGILDLGPKMAVITDGGKGSYGYDGLPACPSGRQAGRQGLSYFKLGIFPSKLVEMTGSGDAYATGMLAGLFHGKSLAEAMRWGAANGAAVVSEIGPQKGLLTYTKMLDKLKENPKIKAEEF